MDFNNNKPIYLQITDFICENILKEEWKEDARIPAVREIAVELEVNPNTVVRAYNFLQDKKIIYNKRGIGYFVSPDGYGITREYKKDEFVEDDLLSVFKKMDLLKISIQQLNDFYDQFCSKKK